VSWVVERFELFVAGFETLMLVVFVWEVGRYLREGDIFVGVGFFEVWRKFLCVIFS
jgi:hypothetical protein